MEAAAKATRGAVVVEIEAGRASLEETAGAIDAALRSELPGIAVSVPLAAGDPRRAALEALCGADGRVSFDAAPPGELHVSLPIRARPQPRTLPAVVALLRSDGTGRVEVPLPGRLGPLARLGGAGLVASGPGSGSRRLRPGEVGLRSAGSRKPAGPPPKTTLEAERAEHLRHRARSATMRARMDRNAQRLYRERLQNRHDRARHRLADARLASTSRGQWFLWRLRGLGRRVAALPGRLASVARTVRVFLRRARRFAVDRWRTRSAPSQG